MLHEAEPETMENQPAEQLKHWEVAEYGVNLPASQAKHSVELCEGE
jgi:hypothetical protein